MDQLTTDDAELIAPREVRELLTRLTEQTVEAVGPGETRSLSGLALETGVPIDLLRSTLADIRGKQSSRVPVIAVCALALVTAAVWGGWKISHLDPQVTEPVISAPVTTPPVTVADERGLVPLSVVTFGPDAGTQLADTSFVPTNPVPEGISVSANIGKVIWGTGDARSSVFSGPLKADAKEQLVHTIEELLEAARKGAANRKLSFSTPFQGDTPVFRTMVDVRSYYGNSSDTVDLPPPGSNDPAAKNSISKAARRVVNQVQGQWEMQKGFRRMQGP